jgi:preprotein translocase subunit SecA
MSNLLTTVLQSVFGSKADRDLKELTPYVGQVNSIWETLVHEPDQALRDRSAAIKTRIAASLAGIDTQIEGIRTQAQDDNISLSDKDRLYDQIDSLEKDRNKQLEATLLIELPEAFAVMKETARRLAQNGPVWPVLCQEVAFTSAFKSVGGHPKIRSQRCGKLS